VGGGPPPPGLLSSHWTIQLVTQITGAPIVIVFQNSSPAAARFETTCFRSSVWNSRNKKTRPPRSSRGPRQPHHLNATVPLPNPHPPAGHREFQTSHPLLKPHRMFLAPTFSNPRSRPPCHCLWQTTSSLRRMSGSDLNLPTSKFSARQTHFRLLSPPANECGNVLFPPPPHRRNQPAAGIRPPATAISYATTRRGVLSARTTLGQAATMEPAPPRPSSNRRGQNGGARSKKSMRLHSLTYPPSPPKPSAEVLFCVILETCEHIPQAEQTPGQCSHDAARRLLSLPHASSPRIGGYSERSGIRPPLFHRNRFPSTIRRALPTKVVIRRGHKFRIFLPAPSPLMPKAS